MKALAQRYASALADVALAKGAAEQVKRDLASFTALFEESADLRNFLASPAVGGAGKRAVIEKLAARIGASQMVRNFLFVMSDHRRAQELPQIQQAFETELRTRQGVAEAQVTSPVELTAAEKQELQRVLERLSGKKIEARYNIDPALVGGATVQIGTTIYDGSVREQFNRMREKLASE